METNDFHDNARLLTQTCDSGKILKILNLMLPLFAKLKYIEISLNILLFWVLAHLKLGFNLTLNHYMSSRLHWIVTFLSLSLTVLLTFNLFYQPPPKIAYVDSAKLINGYQGMVDARQVFQKKAAGWKANIDTLAQEVQQRIVDYEKASAKMSAKERDLSRELIQNKEQQLREYQQALNSQAQQEDAKMTNDVVSQMNTFIKKYGEEKGYTIILAAANGNIAFAVDYIDLTDQILERLNKEYKGQ